MAEHRVFSGMRPSGRLHVGSYVGALQNWVAIQEEYDCIYYAADVPALTDMQGEVYQECAAAEIGCVEDKRLLAEVQDRMGVRGAMP